MILREMMSKCVQHDALAVDFLMSLHEIADLWDDLIDGDKLFNADAINSAFYSALISLPRNVFYRNHFALLSPLLESAILDWHTSNALEAKKTESALRESYVLRCSLYDVAVMCARIVGGTEWAIKMNVELRTQDDEWTAYAAEHGVK